MRIGPQPDTLRGQVSEPGLKRLWYEKTSGNHIHSCHLQRKKVSSETPGAKEKKTKPSRKKPSSRIPAPAQLPT